METSISANVDDLCKIWEEKQQVFKKNIQALLNRSKQVERELRVTFNAPGDSTISEKQLKLEQLMMHLTVELQRIDDKDNAKREFEKSLDQMRAKITSMSQSLASVNLVDISKIRELCNIKESSQKHYKMLNQTLKKCEVLRSENLPKLIENVRIEIGHWYDMTRQHPPSEDDEEQNDNTEKQLLLKLEQKLDELKKFYSNNTGILDLYDKYVKLFQRMTALEEKANDSNRYRNRGGTLLMEERERNSIYSKLPKIERELNDLVHTYQERTGRRFLVHGVDILTRIANEWRCHRLGKAQTITGSMRKASSVPFVAS